MRMADMHRCIAFDCVVLDDFASDVVIYFIVLCVAFPDYRINLKWNSKTSDVSRRLTKSMNKVGFPPGCLQESDKPEEVRCLFYFGI